MGRDSFLAVREDIAGSFPATRRDRDKSLSEARIDKSKFQPPTSWGAEFFKRIRFSAPSIAK